MDYIFVASVHPDQIGNKLPDIVGATPDAAAIALSSAAAQAGMVGCVKAADRLIRTIKFNCDAGSAPDDLIITMSMGGAAWIEIRKVRLWY